MNLDSIKRKYSTFNNDILSDLLLVSQPYKFKLYHQNQEYLRFDFAYNLQHLLDMKLVHAKVIGNNNRYTTLLLTLTKSGNILLRRLLLPHKNIKKIRFWNYTIPNWFSIIFGILSIICLICSIATPLNMSTFIVDNVEAMIIFAIIFAFSFVGCFGIYNFHFSKYTKHINKAKFNKFSDKHHLNLNTHINIDADVYLFD